MAEQKKLTTIQRINRLFGTDTKIPVDYTRRQVNKYTINNPDIIFATHNKDEYDNKALELKQNKYLKWRWRKANYELDNQQYLNVSNVVLMYRDADLMDGFPEIGAALDIYSEETTYVGNSGKMVNVESKSERIKKILEDLLYNRLQINMVLPMISRSMCKYGNTYMLFDIDINNGIKGWRQLPVYEMERYDGMTDDNPYKGYYMNPSNNELEKDTSTKFVWVGENEFTPYWNWQIAHFRLLYDSLLLPYGMSLLQKSRRHWRMLSQMEDGMLLYRLERSWERRVFKINVGSIDEDDVPAYIDSVANEFKRTPVVDPLTGQLDLRKNVLPVHKDTPIPLLDGRIITIEELAKEYENGKENYVYSVQDGSHSIVPGKVAWCGKNYTAKELIKVTLDDGGYIILAPEHEFIMRYGTKKRADKVCVGESVMPFYRHYISSSNVNFATNQPDNQEQYGKINKIENVGGDDVYCMTVTGSHGEDDRHNFAVLGRGIEQKVHEKLSGCFVSNCYSDDYVIPTRTDDAPNPIDTLPAAQNLTAIDDIKYILNKVLTGLAVPKPFINMEEATGDGKSLSLLDVRFARRVNKIQQCLLIELNKACIVHLAFLGFTDDLTNFTLSMNNPSSQAEMLELENLAKKITTVKDAVMDNGNGIPIMSMTRAWKEILGWSEKEIADNLEELRLEAALGAELKMTNQIIKRTGIFDKVDNIYGEAGAQYGSSPDGGQDDGGGMPGGGGGGAAAFGGDMDMGMPEGEDVEGAEGDMDLGDMAAEEGGAPEGGGETTPSGGNEGSGEQQQLAEAFVRNMNRKLSERKKVILDEKAQKTKHYRELLEKRYKEWEKGVSEQVPLYDKTFLVNEEINSMSKSMDNWLKSVKAKKSIKD